jgi:hypothetical protein
VIDWTEANCGGCRYWAKKAGEKARGECRRRAPAPANADDANEEGWPTYGAAWPLTFDDDWCGEFKPKT